MSGGDSSLKGIHQVVTDASGFANISDSVRLAEFKPFSMEGSHHESSFRSRRGTACGGRGNSPAGAHSEHPSSSMGARKPLKPYARSCSNGEWQIHVGNA